VAVKRYRIYLAITLVVVIGAFAAVVLTGTNPRLGLDLEGGTSVILTATGEGEAVSRDSMEKTVQIIRQRVDAIGVAEPEVTSSNDNILVQLPGVENEREALQVIGTTARLTFRQVREQIPANRPKGKAPEITKAKGPSVEDEEVVYPAADDPSVLYRLAPAKLTGDVITRAQAQLDTQAGNQWSVSLDMNDEGADVWADFTSDMACLRDEGEEVKSQVAIVLDGKVETATGMASPGESAGGGVVCGQGITGGQSQITVGSEQEAKNLALVLRYGSLPITLEQEQVSKVSPTLGRDSLEAGLKAGALGLALVLLYVLLYYRGLGLVVMGGLVVFTLAFYSILAVLGETSGLALSLAGVAGLIVSIGVTTDSYIVAFERLKDEIRSGKSMRAAIDRGIARALKTILVADFVTASAAVILFFLAVGPVKGFALTLGLATLVDVLVAFFFTRPLVNLLGRTKLFVSGRFVGMRQALGAGAQT
jgi:protein-export membrane protein SecD